MDPLELALMQMGIPAEQRRAMMEYIMAQQQPIDPYMGATGYDVRDANRLVDYGRDVNTLMADPMTAAAAGMGAYGGANEIGFQAFDPVLSQPKPVAGPDRALLDRYLSRPTDDIGGWIADQIANQGATAFEVTGQLQQILNGGPYDDPELEARRAQLASMVPSYTDEVTDQTRWDYSGIESLATKLEEQATAAPVPGSFQDEQGNWWTQEQQDSPMTEWYRKQGLPLPTQEYTLSDFTPEGAAYQAQADALGNVYQAQAPMRAALDDRMNQAYETLLRSQELARQQPQRTPQEAALDLTAIQANPQAPVPGQPNAMPQSALDAMWRAQGMEPPGPGQATTDPNRATIGAPTPGTFYPPAANEGIGREGGSNIIELMRSLVDGTRVAAGGMRDRQQQTTDPTGERRAMADFLGVGRARWNAGQPAVDQHFAQQRAQGRRFYDPKTKSFEADRGVAQGNLDYGVARAQGRTPLQDALRARAMAAFMMGG